MGGCLACACPFAVRLLLLVASAVAVHTCMTQPGNATADNRHRTMRMTASRASAACRLVTLLVQEHSPARPAKGSWPAALGTRCCSSQAMHVKCCALQAASTARRGLVTRASSYRPHQECACVRPSTHNGALARRAQHAPLLAARLLQCCGCMPGSR